MADWHEAIMSAGVGFFVGAAFLSRQYNVVTFTVLAIGGSFVALLSCADARATTEFEPRWSDGVAIGTLAAALLVATWIGVRLFAVWSGA
jgi:hypothetical protein